MSKTTGSRKSSSVGRPGERDGEIVFVVDVGSFTEEGFKGSSEYEGRKIEIEFDDRGEGVYLTGEMLARLGAKKGESVNAVVESGATTTATQMKVAGVRAAPRVSDSKVYYGIGSEGGAVLRIRTST